MEIRKASMNDWEEIRKIYAGARQFMAEHGNAGQWGTTYPREELLLDDIAQEKLYVCTEGSIAAVFYFAAEEDPTYRIIKDGAWLNEEPYMLKKNGFCYCGKIHLENGEPRIAFHKIHS